MRFHKTSGAAPGLLDKAINGIGGLVDDAFLTLPKFLKPFKPQREIDRKTYEQQVDFYFDHHYVDQPETFFQLPETLPEYSIASETLFLGGVRREIIFPSQYAPRNSLITERFFSFPENKTARLIQWAHGDPGRKTLVCLHGYMLGDPDQAEKMFKVKTLFQMGLDVVLFITPFHWKRAPEEKMRRGMFLQPDDVVMTCECFGQAMHDLSQSILVLKDMGAGETGLIGASLGGYNAALFASLSDRIAFAALMVPAVKFTGDFSPKAAKLPFQVDKAFLNRLNRLWTLHSPLNFYPKISQNRILVIASRGDKLCPFVYVHELCEQWGWPKHVFMTGGHWLVANARERGRAWYRFLSEMGFIEGK
ncbi:MAG: alpha/beta hydrolase family protein [Desulfobacteraceae bacterium]|nr:alpha/beta hydrolase family protein [Desulfobacteraceae bacterium]MBC2757235.1 alpha/beta hydrolase family protein [Desulfobacteraceae bacterium]